MKKQFKKQVAVGIAGVIGTALLTWGAYETWGIPQIRWITYPVLALLMASFMGFLFYTFGGWRSFLSGAGYGVGFVVLTVAAKELPTWAFGVLIVAAILIFVVRPLIKQYKVDREKSSDEVIDKRVAEEIRLEEAEEAEIDQAEEEFKQSIGFGTKSLLLLANITGAMYQMIRSGDRLYFVRVGGELSGLDVSLMKTDFSDEAVLAKGPKDFFIVSSEIDEITCKYGKAIGTQMENCGEIKIRTRQKRYAFVVLDHVAQEKIETLFNGLPFAVIKKKKPAAPAPVLTEEEKSILPKLKKACLVLTVLAVIAGAAFFFLPIGPVVYRVLSAVCIIIPAVTFGLYIKFNNLLSIEDKGNDDPMFKKSRVNITIPLLIPSAALGVRTIYDFDVTGWVSLIVWSVAVIAVMLLVMFKFTKEYKRKKSVIFMIIFVILYYAPSAVMQINGLYDYSTPVVYSTSLIEKHISEGRNSTRYYFTVELENGKEKDLGVTREYYKTQEPGETVVVVEQSGLLGIDYAYINEVE